MSKTAQWILVLALFGAVGAAFFIGREPARTPGEPVAHLMPLACEACGKAYGAKASLLPVKCRFCGEPRAWRARKCYKKGCGQIFPWIEANTQDGLPAPMQCPKCGSKRVGEVPGSDVQIFES